MEAMKTNAKPRKRKVNLCVPEELDDRLEEQALREQRTKSTVVERAFRLYLDRAEAAPAAQ